MKKKNIPKEIKILSEDLIWAKYDLNQYKIIFNSNQQQRELLTWVAKQFFIRLHHHYWNNFAITISRFTDNSIQGKNKNITVKNLLKYIEKEKIEDSFIKEKFNMIYSASKSFRSKRSKFIAHRDHNQALKIDSNIDLLQLKDVETIYENIGQLLNAYYYATGNNQTSWDLIDDSGAESLLKGLKKIKINTESKAKRTDYQVDDQ